MKETKKILCHFSFYDQVRIQEKLEDMAEQGWMVHQPGNFTWTFKRMEPKKLRFSVAYFPGASEFDPGPTERELTKLDFCAQDGWKLALKWGVMQIFYNEDENAVPIETEPVAQVENVKKSMRKNVLFPHLFEAALIAWYMFMQVGMFRRDPVDYLSDPLRLYQIPMWISLLLACLYEVGFYFLWTRKAKKAAEEDGVFLPIKTNIRASYILLAFSFLLILFAFGSSREYLIAGLIWSAVMFLITFSVNVIKKKLKQKGASRWVNMTVSLGSVFLFTVLFMGVLVSTIIGSGIRLAGDSKPVGSYEHNGRTLDIYDDPLPLVIEDLMEVEGNWSKEMDRQETGLLTYTEYTQRALLTEPRDVLDLNYNIVDVKANELYELCKNAMIQNKDETNDERIPEGHKRIYVAIDPIPWNAKEVYQIHYQDTGSRNSYLLCYEKHIVEITFYWELTPEQITNAAAILRQSYDSMMNLPNRNLAQRICSGVSRPCAR